MAAIPEPKNTIAALIDEWYEKQPSKPRPHLGASLLGHPCKRYLWLSFRWAVREKFSGRMLRLFERGQREELVIVENLRRIGIEIHSTAEDEQTHLELAPHIGGSVDGIIESGVPGAEKARHIAEFKTHNKKSFEELQHKGVYEAKRRHWFQMQCYMHGMGIERALYVAVCKDNDELYTERVEYNRQAAEAAITRGSEIVFSERMPEGISHDPTWYQCRMCGFWGFCHDSHCMTAECVCCRNCAHVTPMPDGTWKCEDMPLFRLSSDEQLEGCYGHVLHPDLVPWRFLPDKSTERSGAFEIGGEIVMNGGQEGDVCSMDLLTGRRREKSEVPF